MSSRAYAATPASTAGSRRDPTEQRIEWALIALVFVLPLLPTGARYAGVDAMWLPESALFLLSVVWWASRSRARSDAFADRAVALPDDVRLVGRGFAAFLLVATGAMVLAIARENVIWSLAFRMRLQEVPWMIWRPIDQGASPMYPLRVWLTLLEGALTFFLVAAICSHASRPRARARAVLWAWVAGFSLVGGIAVFQYVARSDLHEHWARVNPALFRSHATLDDPNTLGSFLVLGVGLALGLALAAPPGRDGRLPRIVAIGAACLGMVALATTVSRSAWAALPLAALIVGAFWPATRSRGRGARSLRRLARGTLVSVAVLVAVLLIARIAVSETPGYRPTNPLQAALSTLDPRVPLEDVLKARNVTWAAAIDMFLEKPLVGVGLGRYPRLLTEYRDGLVPENAHGFFLQVLAEMGLFGLIAFLFLAMTVALALLGSSPRHGRCCGLALGLAIGTLAFFVTSITGHPLLVVSIQLLLGVVLAAGLFAVQPSVAAATANAAAAPPVLVPPDRTPMGPATSATAAPVSMISRSHRRRRLKLKRGVDCVLGAVLLIVLSPLMLVIWVAIRLDSPGRAIFVHSRTGMNRRRRQKDLSFGDRRASVGFGPEFRMFKFRTMKNETDPFAPSPISASDPRITRFGVFLRRTCLDELPQLWNVVRGEMSLVGPRPEMPMIVATYNEAQRSRLDVKPGITGFWQLHGSRNRPMHEGIRLDLLYMKRWSLRLDLAILLATLSFVFRGRNR